ncbi:hypothetical protein RHGRI_004904 [Rhododendron griersonianum]|uniref:Uncharacterized protein n=1 Tax=Rhododendron griersonianum TaxID=479676 RepID=A0AAV6LDM8_9ERIC|nr:hypothetical protein RHGRI_004904 [Rhododendron griersonianum]
MDQQPSRLGTLSCSSIGAPTTPISSRSSTATSLCSSTLTRTNSLLPTPRSTSSSIPRLFYPTPRRKSLYDNKLISSSRGVTRIGGSKLTVRRGGGNSRGCGD